MGSPSFRETRTLFLFFHDVSAAAGGQLVWTNTGTSTSVFLEDGT